MTRMSNRAPNVVRSGVESEAGCVMGGEGRASLRVHRGKEHNLRDVAVKYNDTMDRG